MQNTQDERVWDIFFITFNDYNDINLEIIFTIHIPTININLSVKHYNRVKSYEVFVCHQIFNLG